MVFRTRSKRRSAPTRRLTPEESRQADDDRESVRVLDGSLGLALLAFAIIGIYVAAVLAS